MTNPRRSSAKGNYAAILRLLAKHPKSSLVLDCPCGEGALAQRILDDGFRLEVGDYFPDLFVLPQLKAAKTDLNSRLPFNDQHFDVVICCDGMSDIGFQRNALAEFRRILKPGGTLLLALPNILNIRSRLRFLCSGFLNKFRSPLDEINGQSTTRPIAWWELRYMMVREGFAIRTLTHNRVKIGELLALMLYVIPMIGMLWMAARLWFQRKKTPHALRVLRECNGASVLLGESLIVEATLP